MRLPRGRAILQNAPLQFINLDSVLNAGKVERGHQISGYLEIVYPEGVDLLFLRRGEPMNAVRLGERVLATTIGEVLSRARSSVQGIVSLYEAPPDVVTMAITALAGSPLFEEEITSDIALKASWERLAAERFSGFVEVQRDQEISFLLYDGGSLRKAHSSRNVPLLPEALLSGEGSPTLRMRGFPLPEAPIEQASPAQISFLLTVMNGVVAKLRDLLGSGLIRRMLKSSHEQAMPAHPVLGDFAWDSEGVVQGDSKAPPDALNAAFAEWMDAFAESFRIVLGERLDTLVAGALKDYRFALRSAGFAKHPRWEERLK